MKHDSLLMLMLPMEDSLLLLLLPMEDSLLLPSRDLVGEAVTEGGRGLAWGAGGSSLGDLARGATFSPVMRGLGVVAWREEGSHIFFSVMSCQRVVGLRQPST